MVTKKKGGTSKKKTTRRRKSGIEKMPKAGAIIGFISSAKDPILYTGHLLGDILDGRDNLGHIPKFWVAQAQKHGKQWLLSTGVGYLGGVVVKDILPNTGIIGKAKRSVGGMLKKVI